jgi:hypothetical protein
MRRVFAFMAATTFLMASSMGCVSPWARYPMSTLPDSHCYQSGTHGYSVYSWSCIDGQHVVISQYSSEMLTHLPEKEVVACGTLSKLEQEVAGVCLAGDVAAWGR